MLNIVVPMPMAPIAAAPSPSRPAIAVSTCQQGDGDVGYDVWDASLSIRLFIRSMALRVSPRMCKNIISSRMGQEGLCKKGLRRTVGRRDCGGVLLRLVRFLKHPRERCSEGGSRRCPDVIPTKIFYDYETFVFTFARPVRDGRRSECPEEAVPRRRCVLEGRCGAQPRYRVGQHGV